MIIYERFMKLYEDIPRNKRGNLLKIVTTNIIKKGQRKPLEREFWNSS